jgi:hypothetical protein
MSLRFCKGGFSPFLMGLLLVVSWVPTHAATRLEVPIVATQVPADGKRVPRGWRPDGVSRTDWFEGAQVVLVAPDGSARVLSRDFYSACDPDVSLDAKKVLFAGRKAKDENWAVWEIDLAAGGGARLVSHEKAHCRSPIYLGSLFTLDSPKPWTCVAFVREESGWGEGGLAPLTSICSVKFDGSELRRLALSPGANLDPIQMWDGRVIYASQQYPLAGLLDPLAGRVSLFGVHIDGMEQELYAGGQGRKIRQMPCATPGGKVVFVETDSAPWDGAGQLACVLEQRPRHSYQSLTKDSKVVWLYPSPLGTNSILVSRRLASGKGASEVVRYDLLAGKVEPVFRRAKYHVVQAKAVQPRPLPDGRSTVVETKYRTGKLYGLDLYTADPQFGTNWVPGLIEKIRVIEGVPRPIGQASPPNLPNTRAVGRRLLGEAPVEKDGSFHIEIPADIPVALQALDSNGVAMATCGWTWVKQKENRGCIGCHEDPERIPENRFVMALGRKANQLTLPPSKRRSVGFVEDVFPLLQNRCGSADCHGKEGNPLLLAGKPGEGTQETLERVYKLLLSTTASERQAYVEPGCARTSPLIHSILGRSLSQPWDRSPGLADQTEVKPMPPANAPQLSDAERRLLSEWVDLGAQWRVPAVTPEEPDSALPLANPNDSH